MGNCRGAHGKSAILKRAHEVNATARGVVLIAGFQIGRAGREAKTAMDAGERFVIIEKWRGRHARSQSASSGRILLGSKVSFTRRFSSVGTAGFSITAP